MQNKVRCLSLALISLLLISCSSSPEAPATPENPASDITLPGTEADPEDPATDADPTHPDNVAKAEIAQAITSQKCPSETTDESGFENCLYSILKNRNPAIRSQSQVDCTRGESTQKFVVSTYNVNPGAGLVCDVVKQSDGAMVVFARNDRAYCQNNWHSKLGCENPKPAAVAASAEEEGVVQTATAATRSSIDNTLRNRRLSITVENSVDFTLSAGGCVHVPDSVSWDSFEVKVNNAALGCQESSTGEASSCSVGHYKAEVIGRIKRTFWPDRDVYGLVRQAQAPSKECASWPEQQ